MKTLKPEETPIHQDQTAPSGGTPSSSAQILRFGAQSLSVATQKQTVCENTLSAHCVEMDINQMGHTEIVKAGSFHVGHSFTL